MIFHASKKIFT